MIRRGGEVSRTLSWDCGGNKAQVRDFKQMGADSTLKHIQLS